MQKRVYIPKQNLSKIEICFDVNLSIMKVLRFLTCPLIVSANPQNSKNLFILKIIKLRSVLQPYLEQNVCLSLDCKVNWEK